MFLFNSPFLHHKNQKKSGVFLDLLFQHSFFHIKHVAWDSFLDQVAVTEEGPIIDLDSIMNIFNFVQKDPTKSKMTPIQKDPTPPYIKKWSCRQKIV